LSLIKSPLSSGNKTLDTKFEQIDARFCKIDARLDKIKEVQIKQKEEWNKKWKELINMIQSIFLSTKSDLRSEEDEDSSSLMTSDGGSM